MATLTEASNFIRNGIVFGGLGFAFFIIITLSVMNFSASNQQVVVVPTPAPSASFGMLPPIEFPESAVRPGSFELLLIEGRPPEATSSAPIYFIPNKKPTLFSKRQGLNLGKRLGFLEEPTERSETILDFTDPETNSTLTVDIAFNNLKLNRNYPDSSIFQIPTLTDEKKVSTFAQKYFQDLRTWDNSLSSSTVTYYAHEGQTVRKLADNRNAQLTRVDFFQPAAGFYPIVTGSFYNSEVYLLFSASNSKVEWVLEASYQYFPAELTFSGTYPTISGQDAWDKLTNGEGHIASPTPNNKAIVRRVYLAYYQPHFHQDYLQLVWVFSGDDNFVAYVPAIDPEWINR